MSLRLVHALALLQGPHQATTKVGRRYEQAQRLKSNFFFTSIYVKGDLLLEQ